MKGVRGKKEHFCGGKGTLGKMGAHYQMGQGDTGHGKEQGAESTFPSVFTSKTSLQESQVPESREKGCNTGDAALVEEDPVKEYSGKLDTHESPWALMGCIHK